MLAFKQSGCIRVKLFFSCRSGCICVKWLYSGKNCCIRAKQLFSGKVLYLGKVVVIG